MVEAQGKVCVGVVTVAAVDAQGAEAPLLDCVCHWTVLTMCTGAGRQWWAAMWRLCGGYVAVVRV